MRVSKLVDGRLARGRSAETPPVAGGATDVGDVLLRAGGRIGYYDMDSNSNSVQAQVGPITTAGLEAIDIGDLNQADFSQVDVLFMQNPDNGGYSGAFLNNLAKVHQFVASGGTLILHDRHVSTAASILPGNPGTIVRDFADDANVEVLDHSTLIADGPGGTVTDASLDGGNSSTTGGFRPPRFRQLPGPPEHWRSDRLVRPRIRLVWARSSTRPYRWTTISGAAGRRT